MPFIDLLKVASVLLVWLAVAFLAATTALDDRDADEPAGGPGTIVDRRFRRGRARP